MNEETNGHLLARRLNRMGWSARRLAMAWCVSPGYISDIIKGDRRISPRVALLLEATFGEPSATWWLDRQRNRELDELREQMKVLLNELATDRELRGSGDGRR